nr:hypothetical protein [Tanacetum cinerariifolium]
MEDLKQQYLDKLKRLSNLEYRDEIKIAELTENFNGMSIEIRKKEKLLQEEQWAYLSTHPSKRLHSFCYDDDDDDDDDDEDYTSAITPNEPVLSTEEPDNSLSMGDEHLDTFPATESDEFIKSGVEDLIPIPSESEGIPEHVCDVPSHDNSSPLDVSIDQIEDFSESNEEFSSTDDDSFSFDKIDYVEASPPDSELVSSEIDSLFDEFAGELTLLKSIPPGIDETDCHLEEEIRLTKRLLYDNSSPRLPEEFVSDNSNADIKSFSPSPIPIKDSASHMEEIDLSLNPVEPNSRDFTKDVVENISPTKEPQVLNILPTHPTLQLNMKFQPSSGSLFAYVVWIFLPFLVYSVVPCYLLSLRNEDIIFDLGICNSHFSKPDISHRYGTIKKFNTHHSHLNEYPMMINGKNIPLLDVPLFHFYPP